MYTPTTRLLTILELLQSRGSISGPELAEKLEVEVRSVRRYIAMLRDLGIPVDSEPGRYGAYVLRPGFRLPPLMLTKPEMLAIVLGLVTMRKLGLTGTLGIESATAKIERILPAELSEQARALQEMLALDIRPARLPAAETLVANLSLAAYQHRPIWLEYRSGDQQVSERRVDVYGLAYHVGQWYAAGYCHLRQDLRVFRLDRIQNVTLLEGEFEPPQDFNALQHVWQSLATVPNTYRVEVLLLTTLGDAQARVSPNLAVLEEVGEGVMMRNYVDDLNAIARFLAGVGCRFRVLNPPELRDELRRLAQMIVESVGETED